MIRISTLIIVILTLIGTQLSYAQLNNIYTVVKVGTPASREIHYQIKTPYTFNECKEDFSMLTNSVNLKWGVMIVIAPKSFNTTIGVKSRLLEDNLDANLAMYIYDGVVVVKVSNMQMNGNPLYNHCNDKNINYDIALGDVDTQIRRYAITQIFKYLSQLETAESVKVNTN